jgi:ADP-heptose:LPS heptosyltransferase
MTSTLLQRLPEGSRVAIIRLRSLGDCVLTTPAIRILKEHRPDLSLGIVVEDRYAPIFAGNPDVSAILPPVVAGLARWKPDLTLNFHGGSSSSQLTFASRARLRAGFEHFRFRALYNIQIPKAQRILGVDRKVHTAEHLGSAMFFLGVPAREIPRAQLFSSPVGPRIRGPYAVIHPKASQPDKTWAPDRFRQIAAILENEHDLEPVFIAGPEETLDEFEPYRQIVGASLEELKALLAGASLFLGNDSGPAHMAAAFGLPVIVLCGSSDPAIWGPGKTEGRALVSPKGIDGIGTSDVAAALRTLPVEQPR